MAKTTNRSAELTWTILTEINDRGTRRAEFEYVPDDPFIIAMTVTGVTWCLSRELLAAGLDDDLRDAVGLGQVTIGPAFDNPERIEINLRPPRDQAPCRLTFPRHELAAVLAAAHAAVPPGTESRFFDWDGELRFITGPADPGPDGPAA